MVDLIKRKLITWASQTFKFDNGINYRTGFGWHCSCLDYIDDTLAQTYCAFNS